MLFPNFDLSRMRSRFAMFVLIDIKLFLLLFCALPASFPALINVKTSRPKAKQTACDSGDRHLMETEDGGKYVILNLCEDGVAHTDAQGQCENHGGNLLEILNETSQDSIAQILSKSKLQGSFWMGLKKPASKRMFKWLISGRPAVMYTANPLSEGKYADDTLDWCVIIDTVAKWNEKACKDKEMYLGYICMYSRSANSMPRLTVDYHGSNGVLHEGKTALFHCAAFVGPLGNVSWEIGRHQAGAKFEIGPNDRRATYMKADAPNGTSIRSTLRLKVDSGLSGKVVSCLSYTLKPPSRERFRPLYCDTATLKVEESPPVPKLTVTYHARLDQIVLGWDLNATCTACVGDGGAISWTGLDSAHSPLTRDNLENLKMVQNSAIEKGINNCGTRVTSKLTVKVIHALHAARLVCTSHRTNDPSVMTNTSSRSFKTIYNLPGYDDFPPDPETPSYLSDMFSVIICFLALIIMLVITQRCLGGPEKNTELSRLKAGAGRRQPRRRPVTPTSSKHKNRPGPHQTKKPPRKGAHQHPHHQSRLRRQHEKNSPTVGTCVDTGKLGKVRPARNSRELAEILRVSISEVRARRRAQFQQANQLRKLRHHPGKRRPPPQRGPVGARRGSLKRGATRPDGRTRGEGMHRASGQQATRDTNKARVTIPADRLQNELSMSKAGSNEPEYVERLSKRASTPWLQRSIARSAAQIRTSVWRAFGESGAPEEGNTRASGQNDSSDTSSTIY